MIIEQIPFPPNMHEIYFRNPDFRKTVKNHEIVIFHHHDADGHFAAAAALKAHEAAIIRAQGNQSWTTTIRSIPVNYGYREQDILDQLETTQNTKLDVYVLDFAFELETSEKINKIADFFLTLDHHKTSQEALINKKYAIFNMESSGAKMAFEYFFPGEPIPLVVTLADNRDLWKKVDGREDALQEYFLYAKNTEYHGSHHAFLQHLGNLMFIQKQADEAIAQGEQFVARRDAGIKTIARDSVLSLTTIGGHPAVVFNTPIDKDEACEYLYNDERYSNLIVGAYTFDARGAIFSLRKNANLDLDLSYIAKSHYGGGGHEQAAAFRVSLERGLDILQDKEKWALCWKTSEVDEILKTHISGPNLAAELAKLKTEMRSRATVETDTNYLQILPYITITEEETNSLFFYSRAPGGGESRLYGKDSIGAGGHVDSIPGEEGLAWHLGNEASREVNEELGLDISIDVAYIVKEKFTKGDFRILRRHDTEVEEVHCGLAFNISIPNRSLLKKISPAEIRNPRWLTYDETREMPGDNMEIWTQALLNKV